MASALVVQPPPPSPRRKRLPVDVERPVPPFAAPTTPSESVGVAPPVEESGALAETLVTGAAPLEAVVMRPNASTVTAALV